MKGVARAAGLQSADYEAVVLAFSRLSRAVITEESAGGALTAATETGAVLLQADAAAAYVYDKSSQSVSLGMTYHIDLSSTQASAAASAIALQCMESRSPVVVASTASDERESVQFLTKMGAISILCVPLKVLDNCVGAIMVMSSALKAWSPSDIDVLGAIADQVAFAVWKSGLPGEKKSSAEGISPSDLQLIELANRRIRELSTLNSVGEAVISTLDLEELLNLALDQCLQSIGASIGSIMLMDESNKTLSIKVAKGLSKEIMKSASVEVGNGIAGWVAEHGRPVLVHDARQDPRFTMRSFRDDITSAMSLPLKARGRVIGVLNASTSDAGRRFGPKDVEFLSAVANQVAIAIDNAQLYDGLERRSSELASLLKISEAITSSLELRDILPILEQAFRSVANMDASALLVFDADTERFRCIDGNGLVGSKRKSAYLGLSLVLAKKVLEECHPMGVELTPESPYWSANAEAEGFKCAVGVPLMSSGRVVGVLGLFSKTCREFLPAELATYAALGGLAGVAVHNALVYQHKYEIARSFQYELTPKSPKADGMDVGHKFLPAREVGGDYYDLIQIAPEKTGIVIADVAGNSVRAAMYTSMGRNVLRAYSLEDHTPSAVLEKLNLVACMETQTEVFISVFYGVYDSSSKIFRYACAGHEPVILYKPDGTFESLHADGLLVGIKQDASYEEKSVKLETGSILVMFTDGVVDSPAARDKFGVEQVKEIIAAHAEESAQQLADDIFGRLEDASGSRIQDDVALIVLKVE